jgi:hypothetical protein
MRIPVNGILLLYHHWLAPNAPTIMEHVSALERHSRFKVWSVNTELGFPEALNNLEFRIIVLHYSIFGWLPFSIPGRFVRYLELSQASQKVAFFQDECRYWPQRAEFIYRCQINCVYTLVEPAYFGQTYRRYTRAPKLVYSLPGYVSDELVHIAQRLHKRSADRTVDIGYRGRRLPFVFGKGSQEKHLIGVRFRELAGGLGLRLDIESEEEKRIYGDKYYRFLANCRAVLGVEAGVSIFDIDDTVHQEYERLLAENSRITFEEAFERLLHRYEDRIPYRTISPRHFEAAAFRVCQILFEGRYSGILQPTIHYIPLKKDFSNFEEVIRQFKDEGLRSELTENTYRDLIASGRYGYEKFTENFDEELLAAGCKPEITALQVREVTSMLERGSSYRLLRGHIGSLRHRPFPGRKYVRKLAHSLLKGFKSIRPEHP